MTDYDSSALQTADTDDAQDPTDAGDRQRVPVSGGVLVFESRALGKELVGFRDVTDWDDVADALAARGLRRGSIYHLPELDGAEESVEA